jgi:DNA mismatch endonuclease (patch repair protein)
LPGTPDIVLPKYRTVIFVHGCFWHRHEGCKLAYMPKSNVRKWADKFSKNVERDKTKLRECQQAGWNAVVIWECETRDGSFRKKSGFSKV